MGNTRVTFNPLWLDCEGDELIITASRNPGGGPTGNLAWDFLPETGTNSGVDQAFSDIYGSTLEDGPFPDLGIYIFTGSNP